MGQKLKRFPSFWFSWRKKEVVFAIKQEEFEMLREKVLYTG